MRALWFSVVILCLVLLQGQSAFADRRVALVIGNSAYQHVPRLANPVNDSAAMSATLEEAGFDVVQLKHDLKANEMRRALRDFADIARDADFAIIFFAGHGIEIDGTNYLIPTDAMLERDVDAADEAVPLDRLLSVVEPARKLRLVILDACRDNPFAKDMRRIVASRGVERGLARVDPAGINTLVAFAAKAGSTVADGDSANSPFTAALVKYLTRPGLDIRRAFGFARDDVLKATNNRQEPFIYGSLGGEDFALVPGPEPQADTMPAVRQDYELAERVGTLEAWDSFLSSYPDGFYTRLARAQRNKLLADQARLSAAAKARPAAEAEARRATAPAANTSTAESAGGDLKTGSVPSPDQKPVGPVAALTPPASPADAASDAEAVARALQTELHRVGCGPQAISDRWDGSAQDSLKRFNKNANTRFDVKAPGADALDFVRHQIGRICAPVCEHGYRSDGEACVKIICKDGFELSDDNACERVARQVKRKQTPAASRAPEPRSVPKSRSASEPRTAPGEPGERVNRRAEQAWLTGTYRKCMGALSGCYARSIRNMSPDMARAWCSRAPTC
jgi:uncharacterized caspase-like protein